VNAKTAIASGAVRPGCVEVPAATHPRLETTPRESHGTAETPPSRTLSALEPVQVTPSRKLHQYALSMFFWFTLRLPYIRRVYGLETISRRERCLFVCNHVSLLDTILLAAVFGRTGNLPMLVLGDKGVWSDSWVRRMLSGRFGFMLERGKFNPRRIRELQAFARSKAFHLIVFPEGTRGNGVDVGPCQPGIYYIAQEARLPLVPLFFANMQFVSTKTGRFHPISGLRKIEMHFGQPITPDKYLGLSRDEFTAFVRRSIEEVRDSKPR
jgi:1-acyl-sn-glycerol-3-phosphate acyltransferase